MAAIFIIAEKPSMAREIAAALLGIHPTKGNFFQGSGPAGEEITIGAARGHLLELAKPEAYDKIHGRPFRWRISDLPILPKPNWEFMEIVRPDAAEEMALIARNVLLHSGCEIVNACDAGREGEVIFRKIIATCKFKRDTTTLSRMWGSSMTRDALREAFAKRKPLSSYDGLAKAGFTRDQADWLVGMNKTVLATKTLPRGGGDWKVWSVGRVQTPTLALIVERDEFIENFTAQPFWEVYGKFGDGEVKAELDSYVKSDDRVKLLGASSVAEDRTKARFWKKELADAFAVSAKSGPRYVVKDETVMQTASPKLPFDLQEAQKYCSKRFGMTAKETLALLQELYEAKLISYPRTDSRHFPEDMKDAIYKSVQAALAGVKAVRPDFAISQQQIMPREIAFNSKAFNNGKVSDHYGLCPTGETSGLEDLSTNAFNAYVGIMQAVLVALDEPAKVNVTIRRWIQVSGQGGYFPVRFKAESDQLVHKGWTRWVKLADSKRNIPLPPIAGTSEVLIEEVILKESKTTPPGHFADDTLLDAMKYAGTNFTDAEISDPSKLEEMIEIMKDRGIGTPATRAATIETLLTRGYIERKKKLLVSTENGRMLVSNLRERDAVAVSAAQTAEWEMVLNKMARNEAAQTREQFLQGILDQFLSVQKGFVENSTRSQDGDLTDGTPIAGVLCPKSKQPLLDRGAAFEAPGFPDTIFWKTAFGKTWDPSDVVTLIEGVLAKKPVEFTGLHTKEQRLYSAPLTIDPKTKKVVIHQISEKLSVVCPKSSKAVEDKGKYWICPGWPKLKLWKNAFGKDWTIDGYLTVLAGNLKGDVPFMDDLVSKAGRPFTAKLIVSDENQEKFSLEFQQSAA